MIPQYQKGWTLSFCPPSPIYRRKEGGGCCLAPPGELGYFHQETPPSFCNLQEGPSGSDCYLHPPFSLNTPPFVFFLLNSFRNVAKLYGLCIDTLLTSGMPRDFMDYPSMLFSRVPKGTNKVQKPIASVPDEIRVWQVSCMKTYVWIKNRYVN